MLVYWITGGVLLVYLVLVWFLGSWLSLKSPDIWILRGGLALIGLIGAGSFLWFYRKSKRSADTETASGGQSSSEDINLLVHEALSALRKSTLGRGATLRSLPLLFFVGDSGAAKTHIVIHSGLDPELLAGQVYQDNNVLPTRLANIWYSQPAILVDPAGSLLQQPDRWKRFVKLVRPGRAGSALSKSDQAPRAAIVCYDCANFLKPGASEATLSTARKLGARIHEVSQTLGISLPIYVLFTKLDRLQGFTEFASALNPDEASQVLGTTMPLRSQSTGPYSDEETKRLTSAFDELFFSLADKRLDLLARENDNDSLPAIYEFPREMRKLKTLLVQFLVELARPSRLSVNPFLRGFYFSGVRPVFVEDGVSAVPRASAPENRLDAGATQIFTSPAAQTAAAVAVRSPGRRKVPQWAFLTRLFNEVIVKDRVALAASGVSSNVSMIRRIALICGALLSFVAVVGFVVSFIGNRQLEANVRATAADLQNVHVAEHQLASVADLQKLDKLREELKTLSLYEFEGVPYHLRWGLYVGDRIRPEARRAYFDMFKRLLFDDAQNVILGNLRKLPDQPGPNDANDAYETTYDELKAHLITAQYYDKSTKDFPARLLTALWTKARRADAERTNLAGRQFEYYCAELKSGDPIGTKPDEATIARARIYLAKFGGIERYYRPLIDQASRAASDASFPGKFPDASGVIISNHVVKGAFTPAGFQAFSAAIHDPAHALASEEWVLGKTTATELDSAALQERLVQRYQQDFIKEWREVLQTSSAPPYKDLNDADQKLDRLTSPTSPLLELLWFISSNTNLDNTRESFASVSSLEPPGAPGSLPDQLRQTSNATYIQALTNLQEAVHILSQSPAGQSDTNALAAVMTAAAQAKGAAKTVAAGWKVGNPYHNEQLTQLLLEEPITNVELLIQKKPGQDLNAAGQALCEQFAQYAQVFPFRSNSNEELTMEEFNGFFAPKAGALSTFYEKQLKNYLVKDGSHYKPAPTSALKVNPKFLDFFNRMATVTEVFFPNNSTSPSFTYSLTVQDTNVDDLIFTVGKNPPLSKVGQQGTFTWTGTPEEVRVTASKQTYHNYSGSWAIVRFVQNGIEVSRSYTNFRWNLKQSDGTPVTINGQQAFYAYQLQTSSPNPFEVLRSAAVRCEPKVVLNEAGH